MQISKPIQDHDFPLWLEKFIEVYQKLDTDNLALLKSIYASDIEFSDPLHEISGFTALEAYFSHLYSNLTHCRFNVEEVFFQDDNAALYWVMTFCHPKLNKGRAIRVEGHSKLKGTNDKVFYHRDYLDVGAMLYEHIPFLGKCVKLVKRRTIA